MALIIQEVSSETTTEDQKKKKSEKSCTKDDKNQNLNICLPFVYFFYSSFLGKYMYHKVEGNIVEIPELKTAK